MTFSINAQIIIRGRVREGAGGRARWLGLMVWLGLGQGQRKGYGEA